MAEELPTPEAELTPEVTIPKVIIPEDPERFPITPLPGAPKVSTQRWLLLALIFAFLALLKIKHTLGVAGYNEDGYLYTHLAENIRDGLGLVTNVSLYNKGFSYFPHETNIYPLWPLLLGYASRVIPIDIASRWIPVAFYFLTLFLAYVGVNRLYPKSLFPELWPVLNAGHVAVLMLGSARHFYIHTSLPYTEGMAYALLFATLLMAQGLFKSPTIPKALAVGALAALAMMTRSQMFIAYLALGSGLGLATLLARRRLPWLLATVFMTLGFALTLAPWWVHLSGFIPDLSFNHMLRFDAYRETDHLPVMEMLVKTEGPWAFIKDRAKGIPLAFNGFGRHSYFNNWHMLYQASLVAVPLGLWEFFRALRAGKGPKMWAWMRDPKSFFPLFLAILAIGGILSIHMIHKKEFAAWNFGTRHALTTFFFFFPCIIYLARRPVLPRVWVLALLIVGVYGNIDKVGNFGPKSKVEEGRREEPLKPELVTWLRLKESQEDDIVVAAADSRRLALYTEDVGYHLIDRKTSMRNLQAMTLKLGLDYIIVAQGKTYAFNRNQGFFESAFEKVAGDLDGFDVYKMKEGIRIKPMTKVPGMNTRPRPPRPEGPRSMSAPPGADLPIPAPAISQ